MWECRNANEIVDLKLIAILFLRKIWFVILGTMIGAILVGGSYYVIKVIAAPEPTYESISEFYIDYALDEKGDKYPIFISYTWGNLIKMDIILDSVLKEMETDISKEALRNAVSATLVSDERILTTTSCANTKELAQEISIALEKALIIFGETMKECNEIKVISSQVNPTEVALDIRLGSAILFGSILGFIASFLGLLLYLILDDSIYVPITFTKRYQIPMLGISIEPDELEENFNYMKKKFSVLEEITVAKDIELAQLLETQHSTQFSPMLRLKEADGVILRIKAGERNGKLIDKTIASLALYDCNIVGAILEEADSKLLKWYYCTGLRVKK